MKTREDAQPNGEPAPIVTAIAAGGTPGGSDGAGDFARQMQGSADPSVTPGGPGGKVQASGSSAAASAPPSAAQALRASEPSAPAAAASVAAVKEIAIRIATPQAPAVDVHLVARAGQLQVSVRTADSGLQTSLRQDVGSLVNSLERSGYRAQAFTPPDTSPVGARSAQSNSQDGRQESESGSGGRNGGQGDPPQDSGGGQQQQRRDPRQPKWIAQDTD
jgi:hypothetical protein